MAHLSSVKKEDRRVRITYILCFAALAVYALCIYFEVRNMYLVLQESSYAEDGYYYYLDLFSFIFSLCAYSAAVIFYVLLICKKNIDRKKSLRVSYVIAAAALLSVTIFPFCFNLFYSPELFSFYDIAFNVLRILCFLFVLILGIAFYRSTQRPCSSRFCFFLFAGSTITTFIAILVLLIYFPEIYTFWEILFLFRYIVIIFLPLQAYISYKALTDGEFYQRFVVCHPADTTHLKHSNLYKDDSFSSYSL